MSQSETSFKRYAFKTVALACLIVNSTSAFSETTDLKELKYSVRRQPLPVPFITREQRDNESSISRRRTASYDPQNIRLGEFIVSPTLETGWEYTDNVYGTNRNQREDSFYTVKPQIEVRSDFTLHMIDLKLSAEDGTYSKLKQEDYRDYAANFSGRYDLFPGISLPLALDYTKGHSRRDDPEERRSIDPTVFNVLSGGTGAKLSGYGMEINVRSGFADIKYDDTTSFSGNRIDNSGRDRFLFTNYASFGFASEAVIAPFLYANQRATTYDQNTDSFGINRDSSDTEAGIGSLFNMTSVTKSTVRVGQVRREFDDSSLDPIEALTYSMGLNWEPSTLAGFFLSGERGIKETSTDSSAQLESSLRLAMTYELAPNIILRPGIEYRQREYEGTDFETKAYSGNMEVLYKLNPNIWTTLEYSGTTEQQTGSTIVNTDNYNNNRVSLTLKFQL